MSQLNLFMSANNSFNAFIFSLFFEDIMTQNSQEKLKKENFYIKEIHKRLANFNTDQFSVDDSLPIISRILMRGKKCSLFLNKANFEKLYPVLKDMMIPENDITLIVSNDVLKNEEKTPIEQLPYFVDDSQKTAIPPRLSDLLDQKNIYIFDNDNQTLPSFILINHRSYLVEVVNEETGNPYFVCSLNAPYDAEQAKRLDSYYYSYSKIKMNCTPFLSEKAKLITSQNIPYNTEQNEHRLV